MKFNFQFESLLNIRRHQKKKQQQILGRLLARQHELRDEVNSNRDKLRSFEQFRPGSEKQTAADIRQRYELKQDLQRATWRLRQQQEQLDRNISEQRKELIEANKKMQMLEKLKDRERIQFMEHYRQLEQKQQNAIATQIYNRAK